MASKALKEMGVLELLGAGLEPEGPGRMDWICFVICCEIWSGKLCRAVRELMVAVIADCICC